MTVMGEPLCLPFGVPLVPSLVWENICIRGSRPGPTGISGLERLNEEGRDGASGPAGDLGLSNPAGAPGCSSRGWWWRWPLSGWGLWNLVDLQGADPGDGRPGALGLSQIRRAARGGPAEVMVWWLEVASRPESSTPSWCLSRGPSDMHQAPSWSHCRTPGTHDAQSQGRAMAGLQ